MIAKEKVLKVKFEIEMGPWGNIIYCCDKI